MTKGAKLVAFDSFGTLVRFGVMHHPYRKILKWARENGRKPSNDDARMIMTIDADPEQVFAKMKIFPPMKFLGNLIKKFKKSLIVSFCLKTFCRS